MRQTRRRFTDGETLSTTTAKTPIADPNLMVHNAPVRSLTHAGLTIEGYSASRRANVLASSRIKDRI